MLISGNPYPDFCLFCRQSERSDSRGDFVVTHARTATTQNRPITFSNEGPSTWNVLFFNLRSSAGSMLFVWITQDFPLSSGLGWERIWKVIL